MAGLATTPLSLTSDLPISLLFILKSRGHKIKHFCSYKKAADACQEVPMLDICRQVQGLASSPKLQFWSGQAPEIELSAASQAGSGQFRCIAGPGALASSTALLCRGRFLRSGLNG